MSKAMQKTLDESQLAWLHELKKRADG